MIIPPMNEILSGTYSVSIIFSIIKDYAAKAK